MMKRREFGRTITGGLLGAMTGVTLRPSFALASKREQAKEVTMYLAEDHWDNLSDEDAGYLLRHGVVHAEVDVRKKNAAGVWDLEELKRLREQADAHGIDINMVNFSKIRAGETFEKTVNSIVRGDKKERDQDIDTIITNFENAASLGMKNFRYHWRMTTDYRNGVIKGPGGNNFLSWKLPDNWQSLPEDIGGQIPADAFWKNMDYFLRRIIPVAEELGVTVACHPPDPPLPPGFRGVYTWDYDMFAGMKRYAELANSPNFGFLMCVGTVGEGVVNPKGDEVVDIVRYFAERKMIHTVHLRNIRGRRDDFSEWYPDSGDMDFYRVMKALKDAGYDKAVLPDHMPGTPAHPDDPDRKQAFAFGFGYIQGLIQAVKAEG